MGTHELRVKKLIQTSKMLTTQKSVMKKLYSWYDLDEGN